MDFEAAKIYHYVGLTIAVVVIVVGVDSIKEAGWLNEFGATTMTSTLIVLAVVFSGLIRDRSDANTERIANIERMVKALYDYFGLGGGGGPAGRAGGGGGAGNDSGHAGADRGTDDERGRDGRSDTNAP